MTTSARGAGRRRGLRRFALRRYEVPGLAGGRAAEAVATSRALRHRAWAGAAAIALGLALMVGAAAIRMTARTDAALVAPAVATVTVVEHSPLGSGAMSTILTLTFSTPDGALRVARVELGRTESSWTEGEQVDVRYDPTDPRRLRVTAEPADPAPIPWFVPGVLGAVVVGLGAIARRRQRWIVDVLIDNPWVSASSATVERATGGTRRVVVRMVELTGAPEETTTLAVPLSWRARTLDNLTPVAWVAGSGARFVAAPPGGAPLIGLQRVQRGATSAAGEPPALRSRHGHGT